MLDSNKLKSFISKVKSKDYSLSLVRQNFLNHLKIKYSASKSILSTPTEDEIIQQDGFKFLIKVKQNNNIDKKPVSISSNSNSSHENDVFKYENIDKDLLIDYYSDNNLKFFLVFNKFPILKYHFLLVTSSFESQNTHISQSQIEEAIYLNSLVNGLCFFNGGYKSGASQIRKHLQFIPLSSFENLNFGLFEIFNKFSETVLQSSDEKINFSIQNESLLVEEIEEKDIYFSMKIKGLSSKRHAFIVFKHSLTDIDLTNKQEASLFIYEIYNEEIRKLGLISSEDEILENENYSFLLSDSFMFIIHRERSVVCVNDDLLLNINSIGFIFTFLVNSEKMKEELKKSRIFDDVLCKL